MEPDIQTIEREILQANNSIYKPATLSFKYEGGIKVFPDMLKLREFITRRPPLKEKCMGVFYLKKIHKHMRKITNKLTS